jgi:hypothetical protein
MDIPRIYKVLTVLVTYVSEDLKMRIRQKILVEYFSGRLYGKLFIWKDIVEIRSWSFVVHATCMEVRRHVQE